MPSSSEIVPDRSSPEHGVSANQHSTKDATQATDTPTVTKETPEPRRTRPSRACTVRAQQRLQEQLATERKFRQPKKEQKRRKEEVEDVEDREEEDVDESPSNEQQCGGGSAAKIVTLLVQPPEPSQVPRRSIRSMWELASILNFLHVFRPLLNIKVEFSAEELETALLTPNDTLSDVHIPLLKIIPPITRMALTRDTWVTVLCRKIRDWWIWVAEGDLPIVASHGLEIEAYKSLDPGVRVLILKALCDIRVEQEDIRGHIESSLKSGLHLSTFRKDRVGGDSHGVNFWYEDDSLVGHRLYREIRKAELGKVRTKGSKVPSNVTYHWETVATNLDEFLDVSEKLFSSNSRTEASLGKKLKSDMLPEIEKDHKRKEKILKKQHRQALLLNNFLDVDGFGAGRSLRDRKPVTYTFDDYDRSINEAIKITKQKPPSPEPSLHRRKPDGLEPSANGGLTSSTHLSEPVNDSTSVRSSDFVDDEDVNEQRAESVDRSNRRRQRSQRYSTMDFVETVSDNDESDDDIAGEAVYDEEYIKKRKQGKEVSSASEGDEEYRWEEDNANEEEEEEEEEEDSDSFGASEEDSDEPQRYKKLPRGNTKLRSRSRSNHVQSGLRRSKRATRVDYQQYELSESDNEGTRRAKSRRLVERDEPSDETENNDFSMGSQESEDSGNDPETKVDEEEINDKENDNHHNKSNGTDQEVEEGEGKRRFLDLNELAPVPGSEDGQNTVLKDDDKNTDNS